jgi:vacuolar-type H+-ATPase subunit D/Vma8
MELLSHKAQIALASQGRELLEQKRTALLKEFLRVADQVMEQSDALQQAAVIAQQALAQARSAAGPEAVRSAAMAPRRAERRWRHQCDGVGATSSKAGPALDAGARLFDRGFLPDYR